MAPKLTPATRHAGQTSLSARHPAITQISQNGMMTANSGNWRPTIALRSLSGRCVTPASAMIGVPSAPNATGAVLPMSDRPAAGSGLKPSPISIAAEIATGVPNPAAPSTNAPKQNAISSAWMRRSSAMPTTDWRTMSNVPVSTVMAYTKIALSTIHPIGNNPYNAPSPTAASASDAGIPNTATATATAAPSPASAARCARTCQKPSSPSRTTTGNAATSAEGSRSPNGM